MRQNMQQNLAISTPKNIDGENVRNYFLILEIMCIFAVEKLEISCNYEKRHLEEIRQLEKFA